MLSIIYRHLLNVGLSYNPIRIFVRQPRRAEKVKEMQVIAICCLFLYRIRGYFYNEMRYINLRFTYLVTYVYGVGQMFTTTKQLQFID